MVSRALKSVLMLLCMLAVVSLATGASAQAPGPPNPVLTLNDRHGGLMYPYLPAVDVTWTLDDYAPCGGSTGIPCNTLQRCTAWKTTPGTLSSPKCAPSSANWRTIFVCGGTCSTLPGTSDTSPQLLWGIEYCYRVIGKTRVWSSGACVTIPPPPLAVPIIASPMSRALKDYYRDVLIIPHLILLNMLSGHFQLGLIRPGDVDYADQLKVLKVRRGQYLFMLRRINDPIDANYAVDTVLPVLYPDSITSGSAGANKWMTKLHAADIAAWAHERRSLEAVDKMQGAAAAYLASGSTNQVAAMWARTHARVADAELLLAAQYWDTANSYWPSIINKFQRRLDPDYCIGTYADTTAMLTTDAQQDYSDPWSLALGVTQTPKRCTGANWLYPDDLAFAWPRMLPTVAPVTGPLDADGDLILADPMPTTETGAILISPVSESADGAAQIVADAAALPFSYADDLCEQINVCSSMTRVELTPQVITGDPAGKLKVRAVVRWAGPYPVLAGDLIEFSVPGTPPLQAALDVDLSALVKYAGLAPGPVPLTACYLSARKAKVSRSCATLVVPVS